MALSQSLVQKVFRRLLVDASARRYYREAILREALLVKPHVFLTVKGCVIDGALLRNLRELGCLTVMYYPDYHFLHPNVDEGSFGEYDVFVTTKSFQLDHLRKHLPNTRVGLVHHGYSSDVHRAYLGELRESEYSVDVQYIGNFDRYKHRFLRGLLTRAPQLDLRVIGPQWGGQVRGTPLQRCVAGGALIGFAYSRAIQLARINIALHGGSGQHGWQDLVSTRTFEIPACRGFMLHIDSEEVRSLYHVGTEIDVFSTVDELADKIRFYLARPELRIKMIERAYSRCVPLYSYDSRAREIAEQLTPLGRCP